MKNPLPVILVTGFLGAGKTTFVNGLLTHLRNAGKSVALLINEFGLVNIDSDLLEARAAQVYEVNQGSIFCVCTRDQFLKALNGIANNSPAYDIAVIEATGLANTRDIGEYLIAEPFNNQISIRQNFCLVDAKNFHKVFETLPAARTQVAEASICVVNKIDLVEDEYLPVLDAQLLSLNPDAEIVHTRYGGIDFERMLDSSGTWTARTSLDEDPPRDINSISLKAGAVYRRGYIEEFFNKFSDTLLRAKGFIRLEDGPVYIEIAGNELFMNPDENQHRNQGNLVLIGYSMDTDEVEKEFKKCEVPGT